ncbi:Uncharacterised protein [Raoultella terrigena]|uniref:Uncharacterized protein n=1 Tax=Raoultella terrigena TaxID=577 RepID=A0A3P8J774_RAOTE|nr:Uncharacterised protein [Raoultella terrigena]
MFSSITFNQSGNEMRRIEVVLRELERLTQTINRDDLAAGAGAFTAEQIGFNLGLARNSVSKDLKPAVERRACYQNPRAPGILSASAGHSNPAGSAAG